MAHPLLLTAACAALLCAGPARAVQDCELGGASINPANGNTTAGKTGLMRCKDRDTGRLAREQELRDGRFVGVDRFFDRDGRLQRERSVNDKGNSQGVAREFAPNGQALSEGTYDNGRQIGLSRRWRADGTLVRATAYPSDTTGSTGRGEIASADFTARGQLSELRCADRPVLAPAVDDRKLCGFAGGGPSQVETFDGEGVLTGRLRIDAGRVLRRESLYASGRPESIEEIKDGQHTERRFADNGTLRRERQSIAPASGNARGATVLDREFSEAGTLVREQRWTPAGRAASDSTFYLNGQPKARLVYQGEGATATVEETGFHDNGKTSYTGVYLAGTRYGRTPQGVHRRFDEQGRLVAEAAFDDRGRPTREKAWDEAGKLVRDDEVFADGSRKANAR